MVFLFLDDTIGIVLKHFCALVPIINKYGINQALFDKNTVKFDNRKLKIDKTAKSWH
jgi:hypothetical protein